MSWAVAKERTGSFHWGDADRVGQRRELSAQYNLTCTLSYINKCLLVHLQVEKHTVDKLNKLPRRTETQVGTTQTNEQDAVCNTEASPKRSLQSPPPFPTKGKRSPRLLGVQPWRLTPGKQSNIPTRSLYFPVSEL